MPPETTPTSQLNITQNDVMGVVRRIIDVDGLETARVAFKQMNEFFSGIRGWAETTEAVYALIAERRKEEKLQQLQEKLEEQRAGAPSIIMMNQNEANGRKVLNREVTMTGEKAVYNEDVDDKHKH